jgi:hypothetical protein
MTINETIQIVYTISSFASSGYLCFELLSSRPPHQQTSHRQRKKIQATIDDTERYKKISERRMDAWDAFAAMLDHRLNSIKPASRA